MIVNEYKILGEATLTAYLQKPSNQIYKASERPAILVLPGGGYGHISDRECEPVALAYSAKGYQAFTLVYTVGEKGVFPNPQLQAFSALAFIRDKAKEFNINKDKIAVVGFSAGGHLCASVGVHWNNKDLQKSAGVAGGANKPNALVLVYPCITAKDGMRYEGIKTVHGKGLTENELKLLSCEDYVSSHTPPTYICHTADDSTVPSVNSLLFATNLAKNNIPYKMNIYKNGIHGMSLATRAVTPYNEDTPSLVSQKAKDEHRIFSKWFEESVQFLNEIFDFE